MLALEPIILDLGAQRCVFGELIHPAAHFAAHDADVEHVPGNAIGERRGVAWNVLNIGIMVPKAMSLAVVACPKS